MNQATLTRATDNPNYLIGPMFFLNKKISCSCFVDVIFENIKSQEKNK